MKEALIDTDILSYFLKGDKTITTRFSEYLDYFPCIKFSIISYYEISSGLKHRDAGRKQVVFEQFCIENEIIPLSLKSAQIAGDLYAQIRKNGLVVDDMDLLIASIARV